MPGLIITVPANISFGIFYEILAKCIFPKQKKYSEIFAVIRLLTYSTIP
jgi:hypothetical protein